jgi:hypothetical protein
MRCLKCSAVKRWSRFWPATTKLLARQLVCDKLLYVVSSVARVPADLQAPLAVMHHIRGSANPLVSLSVHFEMLRGITSAREFIQHRPRIEQ